MDPRLGRVQFGLDFRHLDDADLSKFAEQAQHLSELYSTRDRPGVRDIFGMLALAAHEWRNEDDGTLQSIVGSVQADATGPVAHQIDDVGTAMARVLVLREDWTLSPALRGIWADVFRNLESDIVERQHRRESGL